MGKAAKWTAPAVTLLAALATGAGAQLPDQSFEVVPEVGARVTVGDSVSLRFRVRLDERDLLYDTVPKAMAVPPGVRVLSVEKLQRGADRIYTGRARLAFYRPGRQPVPLFGLPFMRGVKGITRGMLTSDSAFVDVEPVAPLGNPSFKDIKALAPWRRPSLVLVGTALGALASAVAVGFLGRRRRPPRPPQAAHAVREAPSAGPYEAALTQLAEIGPYGRTGHADPAGYYEAVANVLRDYLAAAAAVPARSRTTTELVGLLPPRLSLDGLRERCRSTLADADLVKFAQAPRDAGAAAAFVENTRGLLDEWHVALSRE